ncbi:MAG TPA: putative Ig domain-containing protein [Gammaproteobacteria bacterium]|nr:putative Ig domain-containing protein [Gammaproteobacteria bacterium]
MDGTIRERTVCAFAPLLVLLSTLAFAAPAVADLAIVSTPVTTAIVDQPYSYKLEATDTDGSGGGDDKPKLVFSASLLPAWLHLKGDTLSGTPKRANVGSNPVVVLASTKDQTAVQSFTIDVAPAANAAPTLTSPISPDPQTTTEGADYRFDASKFFGDPDGDRLSFQATGLPTGIKGDAGGSIAGRAAKGAAASSPYSVNVTASDGALAASDAFTLIVVAANLAPTASQIAPDPQSATEGAAYSFNVSGFFSDPDGGQLTYSISGQPAGIGIDASSGVISGTPAAGSAGAHTVTVTASDGTDAASDSFTLNVAAANRAPELTGPIAPDPQSATEGADYGFDVAKFFRDPDADKLSFAASGLPNGISIDASAGRISGRAAVGTAAGSPYHVTVTASDDGKLSISDSFDLNVAASNRPPELSSPISPAKQSTSEGADYRFEAAKFFKDPDGDALTYSASGLPSGIGIDASTGVVSGKSAAGSSSGSPYNVTVTASDASGGASGSYTLEVKAANQPPSLPDPPPRLSTPEDTPLTITPAMLQAQDEDVSSLTVVLTPPDPGAHFTITGGATVRPEANFSGTLQVGAEVKDSAGAKSNTVTVTVDVTAVNDAPTIKAIPDQSASEGAAFSLELAKFVTDAEGDTLSFAAANLPPGLALDGSTGVLAGTPPVGAAGDYRVDLTVSDGAANGTAKFLVKVAAAGRADLQAAASVAPNPVLTSETATWTLGVQNAGAVDVANVDLAAAFSGDVPLRFDPVDAACSMQQQGAETDVTCRLGPLAPGASASVQVTGSASQAGQATVAVTVSIADPVPIDDVAANDKAQASLDITQSLTSTPAQHLDAPGAHAAAAGDFNGDGHDDVAVATASGPLVFLNAADPANSQKLAFVTVPLSMPEPADATGVAAADLDGDGDVDLAVASASGSSAVLINGGTGAFEARALDSGASGSRAVAAADVNGDGTIDLVFANDAADAIYINDGAGNFKRADLSGGGLHSVDVVAANLVGDALPELVFASSDGGATIYSNAGGVFTPMTLDTGAATSVAAADFDGNGIIDLAFGEAQGPNRVYLNTSSSALSFFPAAEIGGVATVDVLAGDFDLDGLNDVLTINSVGGHELFANSGGASTKFLLHPDQFSTASAVGAAAGKFNGDDRVDVAVAGADVLAVFFNDGHGNLGLGDVDAPTLSLNGEQTVTVTIGAQYTDAGATASDALDGDLTSKIKVTNPVDTNVIGAYTVSYDVVDSSGNAAPTLQRTVNVQARDAGGGGGGGSVGIGLGLLGLAALLARRRLGSISHGASR